MTHNHEFQPGACSIHLRMYGKEKTTAHEGKTQHKLEQQFFLVNLQLRHPDWSREIHPMTTYVLPFRIPLPASLPATDSLRRNRDSYRVQYKIDAKAGPMNRKFIYVHVMSAPLPDDRVPYLVSPQSYNLSSLQLIDRGQFLLAAKVEDTHVGKGSDLILHLACQNESTAGVRQIRISLVEYCHWTAKANRSPSSSFNPSVANTLFALENVNLPGLHLSHRTREEVRARTRISHRQATYHMLHRELASSRNRVVIKLPRDLRDTYQGRIANVYHRLVVDVKTDMTVTNPSISIPLRIGNPPVRAGPPTSQPTVAVAQISPTTTGFPSVPPEVLVFAPELIVPPETEMAPPSAIPIVDAVMIPDDASMSPIVYASDDVIFLGDDAVFVDLPSEEQEEDHTLSGRAPLSALSQSPVSLDTLRQEMLASINDYDIISRHMQHESWRQLFSQLSPEDFGSILAFVNVDFDQPRVAFLLASCRDRDFMCAHVVAALQNTAEWNRPNMVHNLMPCCVDVASNESLVLNELNEWEQAVTEDDFTRSRPSAPLAWAI